MRLFAKIFLFFTVFSELFIAVRVFDGWGLFKVTQADLGGIPWLYSVMGVIFGTLASFTIQREWSRWSSLVEAERQEILTLRELWKWVRQLSPDHDKGISESIVSYCETVKEEFVEKRVSIHVDDVVERMRHCVIRVSVANARTEIFFMSLFSRFVESRSKRIFFADDFMSVLLKRTLAICTWLLVILSLFVGIENPVLDYLFTMSVGTIVFMLFVVIDDLDHPLRPGVWHLDARDYDILMREISDSGK